ncbi:MAG: GntR family transcriptional regulator [Clostridia bacterium]|nr:GntR family transcriptional regulator [Clostridia bacterium]
MVLDVLSEGDKLPSVRELALLLKINPNTIQKAYKQLEQDGYVASAVGKGNFVKDHQTIIKKYQQSIEMILENGFIALLHIGESKGSILKRCESILEGLDD